MLPHSFWALSLIRTQNTATAVWTVTSECPETAVKAFLNAPLGSCLTSTNDSFPEGRAITHHFWSFLQILWFGCACILFYGSNILVSDELACGGEGLYSSVSLRLGSYSLLHRVYQLHKQPPSHAHPLQARLLPLRKQKLWQDIS